MFLARRRSSLAVALVALTLAGVGAAAAQSIPDREVTREGVRRALLDTCVYGEAAKEGAKKEVIVDACQCASTRALKGVRSEEHTSELQSH